MAMPMRKRVAVVDLCSATDEDAPAEATDGAAATPTPVPIRVQPVYHARDLPVHDAQDRQLLLDDAALNGDAATVARLLAEGSSAHAHYSYALVHAARCGFADVVDVLLRAGFDVHMSDDVMNFLAAGERADQR
jgi:hypothetical protein